MAAISGPVASPKQASLYQFLAECRTPLIISTSEGLPFTQRQKASWEIPDLTFTERKAVWLENLGDTYGGLCLRASSLNGQLDIIAHSFSLPPQSIAAICQQNLPKESSTDLTNHLWQICRLHARTQLEALAKRVETSLTWNDLILPDECLKTLKQIVTTTRNRFLVYHQGGFASKYNRGLGICALFSGQSGTGKTTAAEIIAKELNLDCYLVDLSQIVSKYIGETEKNLKQIFDAAQGGNAVLLFDEADALFGKRGEVKDARDRYANQEVSYLLQRIETYPGLAILTTNLKDSIDPAFQRRLKFVLDFPFPTRQQRQQIWQQAFPPQTSTQGLSYQRLAQLSVTGGEIANIALDAAFRAVAAGELVQMKHLLQAARADAKRTTRHMSSQETERWV